MEKGFHQLVQNPTHERGGLIDHVYVNDALFADQPFVTQRSVYYSDHDAIVLHIPK